MLNYQQNRGVVKKRSLKNAPTLLLGLLFFHLPPVLEELSILDLVVCFLID
jgi:hypothetical protein